MELAGKLGLPLGRVKVGMLYELSEVLISDDDGPVVSIFTVYPPLLVVDAAIVCEVEVKIPGATDIDAVSEEIEIDKSPSAKTA